MKGLIVILISMSNLVYYCLLSILSILSSNQVLFLCPVLQAVVIRQRKPFRRKDGLFIYFEDNAGVIVNNKGEMKGKSLGRIEKFLKFPEHHRYRVIHLSSFLMNGIKERVAIDGTMAAQYAWCVIHGQ